MRPRMWTMFWLPEGPKITFEEDIAGTYLRIEDLNPHQVMEWHMTPFELLRFGLRCVRTALWR